MRKLLSFLLTALLTFGVGWAATSTVTANRITSSSATWTGTANETWSVTVNGGATNQAVTNGYAQIGTRTNPSTSVTFSTSGITGTITSIVVNCASYNGLATLNATVGGSAFGTQGQATPSWSNNTGGEVSFTGSATGDIVITMTNGSNGRAMYIESITVTYTPSAVTPTCATPTFSPSEGTYSEAQSVTLSCETDGATIYYTTDGSTPTINSTVYSEAIEVNSTMTIQAIAAASGYDNSAVASATYTIITGGGSSSTIYRKVTSTADLVPGNKYIIMYGSGTTAVGMGQYDGSKHFNGVQDLTISNDQVNIAGKDVLELILGGTTDAWTLYTGSGYIRGNDEVSFSIVSSTSANNTKWKITNSVDGANLNGFVVGNALYSRYIRYFSGGSFRHYNASNGEWAYLYVQVNEPALHAEPNPLPIYDNNEVGGRTNSFTVSGENLGTDNVGVDLMYGPFTRSTSGGQSPDWGFPNNNGTINGTVTVTYTGHALSSNGQIRLKNNKVETFVDVNYLYMGPIYIVGNVNDKNWQTVDGVAMTRDENTGMYSVSVNAYNEGNGNAYIYFTKSLNATSFDALGDNRFGPVSNGNWELYNEFADHRGEYCPVDTNANLRTIQMAPGVYNIHVNPATNEFMIEPYVINVTISPEDGTTFTGPNISGTITAEPNDVTIEWSTDGVNWQTYVDGFTATVEQVGNTVTVYARAKNESLNFISSPVSATYERVVAPAPAAPVFSRPGGDVAAGTVVTITAPEGCTLYVDGQQVTNPYQVTINVVTVISAYCVNDEGTPSETVSYAFVISAVCEAEIVFKDNASDSSTDISDNSIKDYYEKGEDYISSVTDISKVYKATTGLKFSSNSVFGTITFNLSDFVDSWKVTHVVLNAKQYGTDNATLTVTTSAGESQTVTLTSSLANYSLDFTGREITSITISATRRAYLKGFTIVYDCTPKDSLHAIVSSGVKGVPYTVADELIGAWAIDNPITGDKLLWAKDQGNLSIDKRPAKVDGVQTDYVKDILTYQKFDWDESNWVVLDFGGIQADPFEFVGHKIEAATVKGIYADNENYTIELTAKPGLVNKDPYTMDVPGYSGYDGPFPADKLGADYEGFNYNSYVPANFMTENHNHDDGNGGIVGFVADDGALPGLEGDQLYFVNPKIQEVAHIWAVWNGGDIFTVYETEQKDLGNGKTENINAWNLNGTFRVAWDYNCLTQDPQTNTELVYGSPTQLIQNMAYEFHAVIKRPVSRNRADDITPQGTADPDDEPSNAYMVYPLDVSDSGTPTAVIELNGMKAVAGVTYYNLMGIESNTPFEGINIVVTRYSDGSISTAKVLK